MRRADVVVVGAGPAGSAAAIVAARAGRRVLLVDRAVFPRDKCCGDGLTTDALRRIEALGCGPEVLAGATVSQAAVRSPSGRVGRFDLPTGPGVFAAVVPRRRLDATLVERARAVGVDVVEGAAVAGVRQTDDHVVVTLGTGEAVGSPYVVAADGAWSPVRRLLDRARSRQGWRADWQAARRYVAVDGPAAAELWVWFDADLLPGYAWSFPVGGGLANVGFCVRAPARVRLSTLDRDLLGRPAVAEALGAWSAVGPLRAWPIPDQLGAEPLTAGRVLFAGDAAGAADPLTGEGIAQALATGALAAQAVVEAGPGRPARAGVRYGAAVARELGRDHRLAAALGRVMAHRHLARAAVRVAGATPWTRRNFARWLFEDYPRAVVLTPGRWRAAVPARPGAWAPGRAEGPAR